MCSARALRPNFAQLLHAPSRQLATGANNREIARALHLTENTVKSYMSSLMQKLNVRNRVEAARMWQQIGA